MSYREESGQVVLTMSREDYEGVLYALDFVMGNSDSDKWGPYKMSLLSDRLNEGNPHYTPWGGL